MAALIVGLILQLFNGAIEFTGMADLLIYPLILLGSGALVSVYSQMGFCIPDVKLYGDWHIPKKDLAIHSDCAGCTGITGADVLPYVCRRINQPAQDLILGISILVIAIIVAYLKVKSTNANAWIPTLFFMMAISIVEIIGVQIGVSNATIFMVVPLLICNAYQILTLHKVTQDEKELTP